MRKSMKLELFVSSKNYSSQSRKIAPLTQELSAFGNLTHLSTGLPYVILFMNRTYNFLHLSKEKTMNKQEIISLTLFIVLLLILGYPGLKYPIH